MLANFGANTVCVSLARDNRWAHWAENDMMSSLSAPADTTVAPIPSLSRAPCLEKNLGGDR